MNKKFLTALLLGAFTIASTSTLVSCKDYDDDINGLQEQIDQKTTEIKNLQAALTKAETDLKAEIANLKQQIADEETRAKAAEDALKADLATEVGRAKAAEQKLTDDLASAVARIASLESRMKAAEDALKAVQDALALEEQARKDADAALEVKLNAAVDDINAKLTALGNDLKDAQEKLQAAIDAEATRAKAAEAVLQGNIDAEAAARELAIKAEQDARKAAIDGLQTQINALDAFDKAIDQRVKKIEDDYLTSADKTELKNLITAEETARKAQVEAVKAELEGKIAQLNTELRALIQQEKEAMETKVNNLETALRQAIADEAEARKQAVADEADARKAADAAEKAERVAAIQDLQGKLDAAVISLQNQINALNTKLTTEVSRLEGLIQAAQNAADAAQDAADAAQIDATEALRQIGEEVTRAKEAERKLGEDLAQEIQDRIDAVAAEKAERVQAITDAINKEVADRNTAIAEAKQAAIDKAGELVQAEATARTEAIKKLNDEVITPLAEKVEKINTNLTTLEALIFESLRSLVLEPASYYHGIQAIDVTTLQFNGLTGLVTADPNADQATDAGTADATATVVAPEIVANYHMNPTTAVVSDDVAKYQFLPLDRKFTKATLTAAQLPVTSVATANGMMTVKAKVQDASLIKNIAADEQVTVIALSYNDTKKKLDGTDEAYNVTSDYAALKASYISNFRVNKAFEPKYTNDGLGLDATTPFTAVPGHTHLAVKAADLTDPLVAPTFEIPYNNAGLDLTELVNTHVAYQDGGTDVAIDANAKDGSLEAQKGISYKFELIGYFVGGKSESAWACINEDGKTFRPQPAKADGKQDAYGAEQNKSEIGHMPLVRVTLTEKISGKVVAVGYMKFRITTANPNLTEHFTNTKAYSLGCDANVVLLYNAASVPADAATAATIALISDTVKQELNIDQATFQAKYTLEMKNATDAKQFDTNGASATELTDYNGAVTVETDGSLTWTVKNNRAYHYFKQDSKPTTMTTFVRYKANDVNDPASPLEYIYVQFIWTPSEINITPTAEFKKDNTARIAEYWYAKNQGVAGTGFDDIHGNVEVVGTGTCKFVFDVKNTLVGNIPQITKDAKYTDINNAMKVHFEFVTPDVTAVKGESGQDYTLLVSADGSQLQAQIGTGIPQTVATIIKTDVTIPADPSDIAGQITFAENDVAKDVLNYAAHNELGDTQTLTAKIGVKVETCDPTNKQIVVKDGTFNVKFLRPITITSGTASFTDAMTSGDTKPVSLTFVDWRNYEFAAHTASEGINYWTYYGVTAIAADMAGITTTLNGGTLGETYLTGITNKLDFTYTPPVDAAAIAAQDFGTLTYKNNGLTVGGFKIRVPIEVTYKWGKIKSYVDCTIGNTIGNVKKQ
ncbi:MAG: hypothetical protein IKM76_04365 [Prevotella sp.]|nr:hypothetical protein [Prevotella sp.]